MSKSERGRAFRMLTRMRPGASVIRVISLFFKATGLVKLC
jgi:hypothetical protein